MVPIKFSSVPLRSPQGYEKKSRRTRCVWFISKHSCRVMPQNLENIFWETTVLNFSCVRASTWHGNIESFEVLYCIDLKNIFISLKEIFVNCYFPQSQCDAIQRTLLVKVFETASLTSWNERAFFLYLYKYNDNGAFSFCFTFCCIYLSNMFETVYLTSSGQGCLGFHLFSHPHPSWHLSIENCGGFNTRKYNKASCLNGIRREVVFWRWENWA